MINEEDPLFGLKPLSYQTFNRFRADIEVDDLDAELKASRETIEESKLKDSFRVLLDEIFYEARMKYEEFIASKEGGERRKREEERNFVSPQLIERPMADALIVQKHDRQGTEADETWFYIEIDSTVDLADLVRVLYTEPRSKYRYQYTQRGNSARLVTFDPASSTFWINTDHDFINAHSDDARSTILLEDVVTAETLWLIAK